MVTTLLRVNAQLAQLEATPLPTDVASNETGTVQNEKEESVTKTFDEWISLAHTTRMQYVFDHFASEPTKERQTQLLLLERQEMALMCRTHARQPTTPSSDTLKQELSEVIKRYKQRADIYPGGEGTLSETDQTQIEETCLRFPAFAHALIQRNPGTKNSDAWTAGYVKFCLRSPGASGLNARHWVKIFVELPNEVDELMRTTLDKRLGATDPNLLRIKKEEGNLALFMKINGSWQKIQGAKTAPVSLSNRVNAQAPAHTMTIQEIFNQMRAKKEGYLDVEVFTEHGVILWDTAHIGSWNPQTNALEKVNLKDPEWIFHLPVWKYMDLEQLEAYFPEQVHWERDIPHEERFGFVTSATRGTANLEVGDNHGYFYLIIPDKNEKFRVLPCGFQPTQLPEDSLLGKASILMDTRPCIFHYCDESAFRTDRQRAGKFFAITKAEFQSIQGCLKRFIEKSREGKEIFQASGKNCAKHVQKLYDRTIGQRFYGPFEALAAAVLPEEHDIHGQLKRITKELDNAALDALTEKLARQLVLTHDYSRMGELITLCFEAFAYTLNTKEKVKDFTVTQEQATAWVTQLYGVPDITGVDKMMCHDLRVLLRAAIEYQQFYKLSVFESTLDKPLIGSVFRWISQIQNENLRAFCYFLLSLFLAPWRGHTYQKRDGTEKTVRLWSSAPFKNNHLFLPAQMFEWDRMKAQRQQEVQQILQRLKP